MTGCVFKRKLKSGATWGYSFFAGWSADGKRSQVFKSGYATKTAASSALRDAITDFEQTRGRVWEDRGALGVRFWSFSLGDRKQTGFESREAAEQALRRAVEQRAAASAATIDPLFSEYFPYWLSEHVARRCAPKTTERYGELGKYLVHHLGETRLNELTTAQIQQTIHRLKDSGGAVTKEYPAGRPLSAKTVRHMGTLLYTCLAEADRLGRRELAASG